MVYTALRIGRTGNLMMQGWPVLRNMILKNAMTYSAGEPKMNKTPLSGFIYFFT